MSSPKEHGRPSEPTFSGASWRELEKKPEAEGQFAGIRELKLNSDEPKLYLDFLVDPRNCYHYTGIYFETSEDKFRPLNLKEFKKYLSAPNRHPFVAVDIKDKILGFAVVEDAEEGHMEHTIRRFGVINEMQGKKDARVGKKFLSELVNWAAENKRTRIAAEAVLYVPCWERVDAFFYNEGFEAKNRNRDKVKVFIPPGVSLPGEDEAEKDRYPNGRLVLRSTQDYVVEVSIFIYRELIEGMKRDISSSGDLKGYEQ